jgi:hypothetical protein
MAAGKVCAAADKGRGDPVGAIRRHLSAISRKCHCDRCTFFEMLAQIVRHAAFYLQSCGRDFRSPRIACTDTNRPAADDYVLCKNVRVG